jgi:hypothetical protein
MESRSSSVSVVTRPWAGRSRNRGSISGKYKRFFFSPQRPDRLWGPPASYPIVQGLHPRSKATGGVKLTTLQCRNTKRSKHFSIQTCRHSSRIHSVGSEVITAVFVKNSVFWDTTQYSSLKSTDVSEENIASIFRVEELFKQETSVKYIASRALFSSETLVDL